MFVQEVIISVLVFDLLRRYKQMTGMLVQGVIILCTVVQFGQNM